jgi:hypothetical protein
VFPGEDKLGLCAVSQSGTRKAADLYCFGRSHRTTLSADFHAVIAGLRSGSSGEEKPFLRGSFSTAREKPVHGSPGLRSELRQVHPTTPKSGAQRDPEATGARELQGCSREFFGECGGFIGHHAIFRETTFVFPGTTPATTH